jgi:hypothetical protein
MENDIMIPEGKRVSLAEMDAMFISCSHCQHSLYNNGLDVYQCSVKQIVIKSEDLKTTAKECNSRDPIKWSVRE